MCDATAYVCYGPKADIGGEMLKAVCKLGLEGIVSKKLDGPYRSGPSKVWLKIKNPKAPAATRAIDGIFEAGNTLVSVAIIGPILDRDVGTES
jgi:hypothetical protein